MPAYSCQSEAEPVAENSSADQAFETLLHYAAETHPSDLALPWKIELESPRHMQLGREGLEIDHFPNEKGQRNVVIGKLSPNSWAKKIIIEVTLKTLLCEKLGGVSLGLCNGRRQEHLTFFSDRIELHHAKIKIPADSASDFTSYKFVVDGNDLFIHRNGCSLFEGENVLRHPGHRPPAVEFGATVAASRGLALWKELKVDATGPARLPRVPLHPARHSVIYREKGVFPLFPHLTKTADGRLFIECTMRSSASHINVRGATLTLASTDEGQTWQRTTEHPINPARIGKNGDLVFANANGWAYGSDEKLATQLTADGVELRWRDAEYAYARGCFSSRSTDGGGTWDKTPVPFPRAGVVMHYHESATLLRLDENTQLRAVYAKTRAGAQSGYYESYVLRTEDNGVTWEAVPLYSDPEEKLAFGETTIAEAANGDVVAILRQEPAIPHATLWVSRHLPLWISRSTDRGKTWTTPGKTPMAGHPAALLRLRDGTLVCTYGHRPHPMGIRAAISRDHGKSWSGTDDIILRADGFGNPADNGYPITVELTNGSLFTAYYFTDESGSTSISGTHWKL